MSTPKNISFTSSKEQINEENSIDNQLFLLIKEDKNENRINKRNNHIKYKKNKLIKNSQSMPNLLNLIVKRNSKINIKNKTINLLQKNKIIPLIELEKKVYNHFINYYINDDDYNKQKIDEIVNNEKSHLVAEFKDFLVIGDLAEFLQEYYSFEEIKLIYPQILEYYNENLFIFPNYVILPESKYIYLNIQKKQKIIDVQEENEENENIKNKKEMNNIFTHNEIESLLNQTNTSGIKQYFGLSISNTENSNGIDKNEKQILKLIDNINDIEKYGQKRNKINTKHNKINNNKIFYKINKNKIKEENIKYNKEINSRNKNNSGIKGNGINLTSKRYNLSQLNIKNQNNIFNTIMSISINKSKIYKDKTNLTKNTNMDKEKLINNKIGQNNNNKKAEYINIDSKIYKKIKNKNNSLSNENILNHKNSTINELSKLNKTLKINKNILNEINNIQNNKKENNISSINNKSHKKLLMNILLNSRIRTRNDTNNNIKSKFSKKIINHKNINNSYFDSIKDKYLTSTINKKNKSISIGKTNFLLKNWNFLNLRNIENSKQEIINKNKVSSSCNIMSINSYINKKSNISKDNINYFANRNYRNSYYKLKTNISNNKNSNKEYNNNKYLNKYLTCEDNISNKNINKKEIKTLFNIYSQKELRKKNKKSKGSHKNLIDFKLLKVQKKAYNSNLIGNIKNKKPKNKSPMRYNDNYIFPLTDRKVKNQINLNLVKIDYLSKRIKNIKETLKKSAKKYSIQISSITSKNKSKIIKSIEKKESKKNINSNNIIKVYLADKGRNRNRNKDKEKKGSINGGIISSNEVYNSKFVFIDEKNKNYNNNQSINSKNDKKNSLDNFNKKGYKIINNNKLY